MKPLIVSAILFLISLHSFADAGSIGLNYGRVANNLPSAVKVVQLMKSQGVERKKVYDTDPAVLKALSGSGMKFTVDLPNEQLYQAAKKPSLAFSWVQKNVASYHPHTQIEAIAVGNEVFVDPHDTTKFLNFVRVDFLNKVTAGWVSVEGDIARTAMPVTHSSLVLFFFFFCQWQISHRPVSL